jgi:hypothetical protein
MTLKRIGVLSVGKVAVVLYGSLGLIAGLILSLFSLLGVAIGAASGDENAILGAVFGVGAIIILPIVYGLMGFIVGIIAASLYNLAARFTGGIELDLR